MNTNIFPPFYFLDDPDDDNDGILDIYDDDDDGDGILDVDDDDWVAARDEMWLESLDSTQHFRTCKSQMIFKQTKKQELQNFMTLAHESLICMITPLTINMQHHSTHGP